MNEIPQYVYGRCERQQKDPFDLLGLVVLNTGWYLLLGVGAAVYWAVLFPLISVPVVIALFAGMSFGWPTGLVVAGFEALGLAWWRRRCPELFDLWVTQRARARFLTWWRYRRRWARLMNACRLTITSDDWQVLHPKLLTVDIGEVIDRVQVRMLPSQAPADYDNRVEALAHAFGADQCHASIIGPAIVELRFRRGDALAGTVLRPRIDHWTKPNHFGRGWPE